MPINHKFVSTIADNSDTDIVRPSNWNDEHDISALSHTELQDIGANTHAQIDTHISDDDIHVDHTAIETISEDIDFSASSSENITIDVSDRPRSVLRGRLWIDADPGAAFSQWATLTFYNKSSMKGEDAFFRMSMKLVYTELEVATTGSDADITPDDHTDFSPNDLIVILDTTDEYCRLMTIADTLIAEDNVSAHVINTGISRVIEFTGFPLFSNESGSDIYCKIEFSSSQTVSLKLEMLVN